MSGLRMAAAGLLAAALAACGRQAATPPAAVAVPKLETWTVSPEKAPLERVWDGVVEAVNQATLSAQTSGRVVELPYDVDDYVPAGAVVVRFTDVEQQSAQRRAQAQVAAAEAAFKDAEAEFKRVSEIYERKLVARAQLDQATARRDAARASLEAARAAQREAAEQTDYTVVRAPYSGIVTQRHVQVGESVRPGQPLISGLSLEKLRVRVDLPQSDAATIREFHQAAVLLSDGKRIDARAVTLFPYADPATHSFKVRVELPDGDSGLMPGMTIKTAFVIGSAERLLVPASALVRRSEVSGVYVVDDKGVALRQVRLGHRFGDRVEVQAGIAPGERIATDPLAAGQWLVEANRGKAAP